jgi:hypothetical protein
MPQNQLEPLSIHTAKYENVNELFWKIRGKKNLTVPLDNIKENWPSTISTCFVHQTGIYQNVHAEMQPQ